MQQLRPGYTTWHITFGTYGSRPHGGFRATVDKTHNERGEPFIRENEARESSARGRMKFQPIILTIEQRTFIEATIPGITERGGWILRTCAADPDHVHVVLDVVPSVHGEKVRRLIKRWLGQAIGEQWPLPRGASWWAEEGSNKPIHDVEYLNNAYDYVFGQRAS